MRRTSASRKASVSGGRVSAQCGTCFLTLSFAVRLIFIFISFRQCSAARVLGRSGLALIPLSASEGKVRGTERREAHFLECHAFRHGRTWRVRSPFGAPSWRLLASGP